MGSNVTPTYSDASARKGILEKHLSEIATGFNPNMFMTIDFFKPKGFPDLDKLYQRRSGDIKNFQHGIMNRLDRFVYGRNHFRIEDSEKYPYISRVEHFNKSGIKVPAHIHILARLPEDHLKRILQRDPETWEECLTEEGWKLTGRFDSYARRLQFDPDIDVRLFQLGSGNIGYIFKVPREEDLSIQFRLSHSMDDPVASNVPPGDLILQ